MADLHLLPEPELRNQAPDWVLRVSAAAGHFAGRGLQLVRALLCAIQFVFGTCFSSCAISDLSKSTFGPSVM